MAKAATENSQHKQAKRIAAFATAILVAVTTVALSALPARAAAAYRINLRVLVVAGGDAPTQGLSVEMDRLGIPYTKVDVTSSTRPVINQAFLEDSVNNTAKFQAVILPNQAGGGLAAAELTALTAFELKYGIRQINGYDWPSATMGLPNGGATSGATDGAAATVSATGLAGSFSYLKGAFTFDTGSFGAVSTAPAATYTSLIDTTLNGVSGTIMGVYANAGVEQLVSLVNYNENQQWFAQLAPGMLSWVTRGVFLGYQRNYFNVHIDDVFLPDSRWSIVGNCTPGDGCTDNTVTTTDIKLNVADVTRLTTWQTANNLKLTMVFNGGGQALALNPPAGESTSDTAANAALLANKTQFPWVNHTYTHQFLGCTQIAPTVAGQLWHCATSATETPRQDPEIPSVCDTTANICWDTTAGITQQVGDNITWATTNALPNYDPTELVTGEHSGLKTSPQQPVDNPYLGPALTALGIKVTGSDASREPATRAVAGSTVTTVPRYPMNIFYNAGTFQDEVDEYNWIYTSAANGGGDICTQNPLTSTCITPLDASTPAAATASFNSYIKPIEITNALRKVLTNDPRPFYAHQSNLAEDGILYPVLDGVIAAYGATYNTTSTPLVQNSMTQEQATLAQLDAWNAAKSGVDGYIDTSGVHLPSTPVAVPLTVPSGSTATGVAPYAGALSGWLGGGSTATVPTTGYTFGPTAPAAPTIGTATAGPGVGAATLTWTAPIFDGNSPITGYTVRVYANGVLTTTTATAAANATSVTVSGLTSGTSYTFDVAATNAVGTGPYSAISSPAVLATGGPVAPTALTATAGYAQATLAWTPPTYDGGANISGYTIRVYANGTLTTTTGSANATDTTATVTGLTPGTSYTFDIAAINANATGAFSAQSNAVIPTGLPGAPTVVTAVPGSTTATVSWVAPVNTGFTPITGYTVRAYRNGAATSTVTASVTTSATTTVVGGLTNGDQWTFDVAAINVNGTGPYSTKSAPVTPRGSLTPLPSNVVGQAGNASATVTWAPPSGTVGITGYRVRAYVGTGTAAARTTTVPVTSLSASLAGLTNGTAYTFDVAALTTASTGPVSLRSAAVTPGLDQQANGAPSITGVTGGTTSLVVTWNPPADTSGSTPSGYRVRVFSGPTGTAAVRTATVAGTLGTATVTGLTFGVSYSVEVNVQYAGANGAISARSAVTAPTATVPGAPTIGTAANGVQGGAVTATARWAAPASNGGAAITGYIVTATSTTSGASVTSPTLASGSRSYQMALAADTYTFSVVALNAIGASPSSAQSNVVTAR